MNTLEYALRYAKELQWAVFPVIPNGKIPLVEMGFYRATTDEKQIREWWNKYPKANVGVACGASDLAVIDLDGIAAIERWNLIVESVGGEIGRCAAASTSSGVGNHIVFRQNPNERVFNTAGRIGKGIDTRGYGGYFLVEPSTVLYAGEDASKRGLSEGYVGKYEWLQNYSPFDGYDVIPNSLLELVREKESSVNGKEFKPPKHATRILQRKYELVANAPKGVRNQTLYKSTFFLSHFESQDGEHLDQRDVRETMLIAGRMCGLSEREVSATVESAIRGKY